jgi:hypothetical protein
MWWKHRGGGDSGFFTKSFIRPSVLKSPSVVSLSKKGGGFLGSSRDASDIFSEPVLTMHHTCSNLSEKTQDGLRKKKEYGFADRPLP